MKKFRLIEIFQHRKKILDSHNSSTLVESDDRKQLMIGRVSATNRLDSIGVFVKPYPYSNVGDVEFHYHLVFRGLLVNLLMQYKLQAVSSVQRGFRSYAT